MPNIGPIEGPGPDRHPFYLPDDIWDRVRAFIKPQGTPEQQLAAVQDMGLMPFHKLVAERIRHPFSGKPDLAWQMTVGPPIQFGCSTDWDGPPGQEDGWFRVCFRFGQQTHRPWTEKEVYDSMMEP